MRLSLLLPAVILALFALACSGDSEPEATPTPDVTATPEVPGFEAVLAAWVQSTLQKEYAGPCASANAQDDATKICSTARGERGNMLAFVVGETFSEGTQWVILEEQGDLYRVISTPQITSDNAGVPGVPWPLRTGVELVVAGADPCVNVREGPSIDELAVDCISDGTEIILNAGPAQADDFEWWQVEGRSGWVVADYLRYPDALEEPSSQPTATPEASEGGAGGDEAADATATPLP